MSRNLHNLYRLFVARSDGKIQHFQYATEKEIAACILNELLEEAEELR